MIDPTEADIGRSVLYRRSPRHIEPEDRGVITSFNSSYVFVRYGDDFNSRATRREDLDWTSPRPPISR
jgi:hypothetical protein